MGFNNLMDILKKVRGSYPAFSKRLTEAEALGRWEAAVGPSIAKHTRAIRVQESVLWVEVDHPVWKSELHHRKRQILEILNGGRKAVKPGGKDLGPAQETLKDLFFMDSRPTRDRQPQR